MSTGNVLLTTDGYLKLADMGAARGIGDTGEIVGGDSTSSGRTAKVQPEVRWYIAHGVSTLRPQDIWLADAGDYWMEEEECVFTKPYDPEYARQEVSRSARERAWAI